MEWLFPRAVAGGGGFPAACDLLWKEEPVKEHRRGAFAAHWLGGQECPPSLWRLEAAGPSHGSLKEPLR